MQAGKLLFGSQLIANLLSNILKFANGVLVVTQNGQVNATLLQKSYLICNVQIRTI